MQVKVTKVISKDGNVGLFSTGFSTSGDLVNNEGKEISPTEIGSTGIHLRIRSSPFSDRPYQFSTDQVQGVKASGNDRWEIETVSSTWYLETV